MLVSRLSAEFAQVVTCSKAAEASWKMKYKVARSLPKFCKEKTTC